MTYRIALYSPDTHVSYDGFTPDSQGIGGGVTSRVRLAKALADLGHEVTAWVNCPQPGIVDQVHYQHFSQASRLDCDILWVTKTGQPFDLSNLSDLSVTARLKWLRLGGLAPIQGIEEAGFDTIVVPSNYLRQVVADRGWPGKKTFVCYNGLAVENFLECEQMAPRRDPYGLVCLGHSSKSLQAALQVLRQLRHYDPRFHLEVYGGTAIWGQPEEAVLPEPGVNYHGLVNQKVLISKLFKNAYCIGLQDVKEGFGNALQEAKRAGAIVIASDIGAYSELFQDGYDGFLIQGPAASEPVIQKATTIILELSANPAFADYIRHNAMTSPLDWRVAAKTLTEYWDYLLSEGSQQPAQPEKERVRYVCPHCKESLLSLADGLHCLECGRYFRRVGEIWSFTSSNTYYGEIPKQQLQTLLGEISQKPWPQVINNHPTLTPFLKEYISQEGRGYFHFLFDLSPDSLVLDLGAAYGTISAAFARRCQVISLDNTFLRLAFLKTRCEQDKIEAVSLLHADAFNLPLAAGQFDLATMVGLLEWAGWSNQRVTPEAAQTLLLREAYQALKPGGQLYIGIENRYGLKYLLGEPDEHTGITHITHLSRSQADIKSRALTGTNYQVRTHSQNDYRRLLAETGFDQVNFYAPYPDYRFWTALVPLEPPELLKFYLAEIGHEAAQTDRSAQVKALEWATGELNILSQFADSYAILARKPL